MELTDQLNAEAQKSFDKLSQWVAMNNHAILQAVLFELANNASTVTMQRHLDRSPDK